MAGNPARIIKFRFSNEIIFELLKSEWWQYNFSDFKLKSDINISDFVEYIDKADFEVFTPKKLTFDIIKEQVDSQLA